MIRRRPRGGQRGRNRLRIAQAVLLGVTVGGLVVVADLTVRGGIFTSSTDVTVELDAAGGLYPGANVTYRGSRIGTVSTIDLRPGGGVMARVSLDGDARIPVDTEAVVTNLSPIGEQHLDFRPRSHGGPFLADGSVVAAGDTAVPPRFDAVLRDVTDLAALIDPADVQTVTRELGEAFETETDLLEVARLADSGLTTISDLYPRWHDLMVQSAAPLRTVATRGDDLTEFATQVELLTAELEASDPVLDALVTSAGTTVPVMTDLVSAVDPLLGPLLADTQAVAAPAAAREEGFVHWLRWAPLQMIGMAESTRDGSGWVVLVPNLSPTCSYGTPHASPRSVARQPATLTAACAVVDPIVQQRGAQYVPTPAS